MRYCAIIVPLVGHAAFTDEPDFAILAQEFGVEGEPLVPWLPAQASPQTYEVHGQVQQQQEEYTNWSVEDEGGAEPQGHYKGKKIKLPKYGAPIILPYKGTYHAVKYTVYQPIPFDDWVCVEYFEPVGYVYRRKSDDIECVITKDATRPVYRRPIPLSEAMTGVVIHKVADENALQTRFAQAFQEEQANALHELCDGYRGAEQAMNPLCVAKDAWMTMMKTKETDGAMRVFQVANFTHQLDRRAVKDAAHTSLTETVLKTLGDIIAAPFALLNNNNFPLINNSPFDAYDAPEKSYPGEIIGMIANTESDEILTLMDGAMNRALEAISEARVHLPLETLNEWGQEVNRALESVQRGVQAAPTAVSNAAIEVISEPLEWLKAEIRNLHNHHPHSHHARKRGLAENNELNTHSDFGPLTDYIISQIIDHKPTLTTTRPPYTTTTPKVVYPTPPPYDTLGDFGKTVQAHIVLGRGKCRGITEAMISIIRTLENLPRHIAFYQRTEQSLVSPRDLPGLIPEFHRRTSIFVANQAGQIITLIPAQLERILRGVLGYGVDAGKARRDAKRDYYLRPHQRSVGVQGDLYNDEYLEGEADTDTDLLATVIGLPVQALQGVANTVLGGAGGMLSSVNILGNAGGAVGDVVDLLGSLAGGIFGL